MQTNEEALAKRHITDWGAFILINVTSFGSVAVLVLVSVMSVKLLSNIS